MTTKPPFPFRLLLGQLNTENRAEYRRAMKSIMRLPIKQQQAAMEGLLKKLYDKQMEARPRVFMCTPSRDYESGVGYWNK